MSPTKKSPKAASKRPRPVPETPVVTPRVARRERRRERSREEILEAARVVLLRDGIAALTVDKVAKEVGVTKTAIYYYFASKDALLFELVYRAVSSNAQAVQDATAKVDQGGAALRAIIRETVHGFAGQLDDFRLAFLHAQVAGNGAVALAPEQFARLRPLNDMIFARTAALLRDEQKRKPSRARVDPRLMAFLANVSALGVLTMKGMVESVGDPLLYSDEQLVDALSRIFEAAAAP